MGIMKKHTKLLSLTIALFLVVVVFAACGSESSGPKTTTRSISEIKSSGNIIIGVFSDKKPSDM